MRKSGVFKVVLALSAVTIAGCGTQVGSPAGSQGAMPSLSASASVPRQQPDGMGKHKLYGGTYTGTITWSVNGGTNSSNLFTILRFHNKSILGPFRFTYNGEKLRYRLYGRVKSKSKEQMTVAFAIYNNNNNNGGYATGNGTISGGTFVGDAKSTGSGPVVTMHFSVTKS